MRFWLNLAIAAPFLAPAVARADIRLPHIISDHMVLQAANSSAIWGWADPGERITLDFAGHLHRVSAGADGKWRVELSRLRPTDRPMKMTISGARNRLTVNDILIGEVWLASGQSNMEMPFRWEGTAGIFDYQTELNAANYPAIRLFKVTRARASTPQDDVEGHWILCRPGQLNETNFSAAAYYFGRRLHRSLGVPVGMIDSTWGGTRIEEWISASGFGSQVSLKRFASVSAGTVLVDGVKTSEIYNGQIAPLAHFTIRGAIWYQGEGNVSDVHAGDDYTDKMRALVDGWRTAFRNDFPFYYVQVAPYLYHVARPLRVVSPEVAPLLWEAQTQAMSIPGTGMVVATDLVDDLFDIHPRNKKDIGERLAGWALARTYMRSGFIYSGPKFRSMTIAGNAAMIDFDDIGGGLVSRDAKPLNWFSIAGKDGVYYPAMAEISGTRIAVSSQFVPEPVAVRFAWDEAARPNLMNKDGFPALPFRTPPN